MLENLTVDICPQKEKIMFSINTTSSEIPSKNDLEEVNELLASLVYPDIFAPLNYKIPESLIKQSVREWINNNNIEI